MAGIEEVSDGLIRSRLFLGRLIVNSRFRHKHDHWQETRQLTKFFRNARSWHQSQILIEEVNRVGTGLRCRLPRPRSCGLHRLLPLRCLFTQLAWQNWSCRHFAARAFDAARFSPETSALLLPRTKSPES